MGRSHHVGAGLILVGVPALGSRAGVNLAGVLAGELAFVLGLPELGLPELAGLEVARGVAQGLEEPEVRPVRGASPGVPLAPEALLDRRKGEGQGDSGEPLAAPVLGCGSK